MNMSKMDYKIADNMEKYGGSFVKALAQCVRVADPVNMMKLRETFPELFQSYHPSNWVRKENNET